jgi:hypothetical protein
MRKFEEHPKPLITTTRGGFRLSSESALGHADTTEKSPQNNWIPWRP